MILFVHWVDRALSKQGYCTYNFGRAGHTRLQMWLQVMYNFCWWLAYDFYKPIFNYYHMTDW